MSVKEYITSQIYESKGVKSMLSMDLLASKLCSLTTFYQEDIHQDEYVPQQVHRQLPEYDFMTVINGLVS